MLACGGTAAAREGEKVWQRVRLHDCGTVSGGEWCGVAGELLAAWSG
jgi:hypothetical protein